MNFADFLNESKITLKRQYTEFYPAKTAGKHASVRNRVIEAVKDGILTKSDFNAILKEMSADDSRWLRRNVQYFSIKEDQVSLSKFGKKILSQLNTMKEENETSESEELDETGYRPMTDAERQKKQYKEQQLKRLRAVDKKEEEGKRLRALQQKLHQQKMRKSNESFIYESFAEFVENQLNEKAYQMTGMYGAKGILGKVLFAFKKEIEKIKFEGNTDSTLEELNKVWTKWAPKEGAKIIEQEVMKGVKDKESIVYITASLDTEWEADTINGLNSSGNAQLFVRIPGDFVINVGFAHDADANKFSNKLGGSTNDAIPMKTDLDILGAYDDLVGRNNTEIRGSLILSIDAK